MEKITAESIIAMEGILDFFYADGSRNWAYWKWAHEQMQVLVEKFPYNEALLTNQEQVEDVLVRAEKESPKVVSAIHRVISAKGFFHHFSD